VVDGNQNRQRYFTAGELAEMFTLDDPQRSETHRILQQAHGDGEEDDGPAGLREHMARIEGMDGVAGISRHDLLYTQPKERKAAEDTTDAAGGEASAGGSLEDPAVVESSSSGEEGESVDRPAGRDRRVTLDQFYSHIEREEEGLPPPGDDFWHPVLPSSPASPWGRELPDDPIEEEAEDTAAAPTTTSAGGSGAPTGKAWRQTSLGSFFPTAPTIEEEEEAGEAGTSAPSLSWGEVPDSDQEEEGSPEVPASSPPLHRVSEGSGGGYGTPEGDLEAWGVGETPGMSGGSSPGNSLLDSASGGGGGSPMVSCVSGGMGGLSVEDILSQVSLEEHEEEEREGSMGDPLAGEEEAEAGDSGPRPEAEETMPGAVQVEEEDGDAMHGTPNGMPA